MSQPHSRDAAGGAWEGERECKALRFADSSLISAVFLRLVLVFIFCMFLYDRRNCDSNNIIIYNFIM